MDDATRRDGLAVLLLGCNPWAVALVWPPLADGELQIRALVGPSLACLAPLLLGCALVAALGTRLAPARWAAGALLLAVYPTALAVCVALAPAERNAQHLGPLSLALLFLSLCAYGASAARACAEPASELAATQHALGSEPWDAPEPERRVLQRAIATLCACGAVALAIVAPAIGGPTALQDAWGDAAAQGGVLTTVVGAALGVTVIGVFLGSALREGRVEAAHPEAPLRTAWFLFLALLGAVTYFVVS